MSGNQSVEWVRHGKVAVISIDYPPVNALSKSVREGLLAAMQDIVKDNSVDAAVLWGGEKRFIAGADLKEMSLPPDEPFLPDVIAAIDACPKPIVAAIGGAALGGGLEIALACDARIGGKDASLGLTETRLGLIPGSGGTQRLPRLVGVARAIALIAEGRILYGAQARDYGILDRIVETELLEAAIADAPRTAKRRLSSLPVPADNDADIAAAEDIARRGAKGVPAIADVLPIIRAAATVSFAEGLKQERAAFLRLRESSEARALRHLFLAEREVTKVPGLEGVKPRPFQSVAVIGAGTMGAGIAAALADGGLDVLVVERDEAASASGKTRLDGIYDGIVKRGRLTADAAQARRARIRSTADWEGLRRADLVIEAAFEDMAVKTDIFGRLDGLVRPGAVLATNTSYLDIDQIAAATARPEDVLGLHFFSPANVMRLLEIVRAGKTAPDTLATGLALAKRLGKIPVVARICDGFIGNRIYAVYRRHAEYLLEDGATPRQVDDALEAYGFAMGIFAVSDMSGLDIAWAMRKRRAATRDPRERYVAIADRLCESGWLGRKAGRGWYRYENGKSVVDADVQAVIDQERARKGITPRAFTAQEIQHRLLAVMANEGAKILSEGIALRASDIDLAFVNGYGFPRLKGGPMFAADEAGLIHVLADVERAAEAGGAGSEPSALLIELARRGKTFGDWQRERQ